jgi:ABC-2 type transport system ATP-binding protein
MLAELENVCDYLMVIADGGLRLAGEVDELLAAHTLLTGARPDGETAGVPAVLARHTVVESRTSGRQITTLVRPTGPIDGVWQAETPNLEELLLAYLRSPQAPPLFTASSRVSDQNIAKAVAA